MPPVSQPGKNALPCDQNSRGFLAAAFLRQIQAMRLEVDGVRQAKDIEYIHRMRVASRRARNLLPMMSGCVAEKSLQAWGKQLSGITRALGAARDTDVQLDILAGFDKNLFEARAHAGIRRLILRLRQQRARLQARLLRVLDALEEEGALEKIEAQLSKLVREVSLPPAELVEATGAEEATPTHLLYRRAAFFVQRCLDDLLAYEPFIRDPANIKELHAMRISAKHLRYTLEIFGPLYSDGLQEEIRAVRKVQEYLGDVHDCDVWAGYLPAFIEEERARALAYYGHLRTFSALLPGLTLFAQDRAALREATYEEFIQRWQKWAFPVEQKVSFWEALRQRVSQPLLPDRMYPPATEGSPDA